MGREFELKYRANPEQIENIREKYGDFTGISMETTYYDTFDMKLGMHRWTLRRRMENGVSVCTFKKPMDDGSKAEWEVEAPNITDGIMKLCKAGAPWELMRCAAGGVQPICGAKFTRLAKALVLGGCTVEIALDQGVLMGGGKEIPLCEVEVELKDGEDAAAVEFAKALAEEFAMVTEEKSKFARALGLTMGVI